MLTGHQLRDSRRRITNTMDSSMLTVLILVLTVTLVRTQKCPEGCTCVTNRINCVGVSEFPSLSGTTQRTLNIYNAYLPVIPPNAFRDTNLGSIYIYRVNIGRIMNCAFNGIRGLRFLSIYEGNITTIESGAFGNITFGTESRISINSISIGTIEPYAFSSFETDGSFNIYAANVTTIRSFAFHNLTLESFSIYQANVNVLQSYAFSEFSGVKAINIYLNTIAELQCDTLNRNFRPNFNRINLNCDCSIAWLVLSNITLEPSVTCFTPTALANRQVRSLNITEVCPSGNYSRTCQKPDASLPAPCPESPSTATQITTGALWIMTLMFVLVVNKC